MAYYRFEHKLENQANYLSLYFNRKDQSQYLINFTKNTQYTQQINIQLEKTHKKQWLQLLVMSDQLSLNFIDTMKNVNGFTLNKPKNVLWRPFVIEQFRKK